MKAKRVFGSIFFLALLVALSAAASAQQPESSRAADEAASVPLPSTTLGTSNSGCVAGSVYDPWCDVDHDGDVDVVDIQLAASHWGHTGTYAVSYWSLTGNSGTTPGAHFLGTTDNNALELKVNSTRALRVEPASNVVYGIRPNLIGGHSSNSATGGVVGATIGGGSGNRVTDDHGTVGGGIDNQAGDGAGAISDRPQATVAGGDENIASGGWAFIGGGWSNQASGEAATVGGGIQNTASGRRATVPGGSNNTAQGDYSFAAGYGAKANHKGSFVLADSTSADFTSVRDDSLRVRFNGGATFVVNNDDWVRFWSSAGRLIDTSTDAHLTTGGVWTDASDRNVKENFAAVDGQEVLARLADVPIQTWNYKAEDPSVRRMGPTGQDFYAAFGLGQDERHMAALDANGVALAAIQGLYQVVQEQKVQIAALEGRIEELEHEVQRLRR